MSSLSAAPSPLLPPPLRVLTLGDGNFSFSAALVALHEGKKPQQQKQKQKQKHKQGNAVAAHHKDDAAADAAAVAETNNSVESAAAAAAAPSAASDQPASVSPSPVAPFVATQRLCLVASSFDSATALHAKYPEAAKLIEKLTTVGATSKRLSAGGKDASLRTVLHDVDATNLQRTLLPQLRTADAASSSSASAVSVDSVPAALRFDVIIFNHPHSGAEDLAVHASLLAHFFHSAAEFLRADDSGAAAAARKSQVHVTLCQRQPEDWRLLESAARHGFRLLSRSEFLEAHYPSYETKRHHVNKTFAKRSVERMELFIFERNNSEAAAATAPVFVKAEQDPTFKHNALSTVIPLPAFRPTLPYEQAIAAIQAASSSAASSSESSSATPSLRTDITCSICSKGFSSERGLFYHTQQVHGANAAGEAVAPPAQEWSCAQCDPPRKFHDESAMQQHVIARHTPGSNSAVALSAAATSSSAATPASAASATSAAALHPCNICSLSFASPELLREHLSGVPPVAPVALLECAVCGRLFPNARALTQHEKAAATAPEKHVRLILAPSTSAHTDPALIGLAAQGRSKMKKLRGMVAKAEGSGQSVVERLGVKKGDSTVPVPAPSSAVASASVPSAAEPAAAPAAAAPSAAASASAVSSDALAPSFPGLDAELVGSARDLDGITESLHLWRRFHVVGSAPHTIQAVFGVRFSEPPAAEEPEEQAKIAAAPRELCVAVCLPAGYAIVQSAAGGGGLPAATNSAPYPSFSFVAPLLIKDAMHTLLMAASPVYAAWKADELNRKLMELFAKQSNGDDEDD